MYLDLADDGRFDAFGGRHAARDFGWTVLIPFFNERALLPATIASLAAQTEPFTLVLVDNGSTDGSAAVAEAACRAHQLDYVLIAERTPGKVAALRSGLRWVRTRWIATCDADTLYPPHYLATAQAILMQPGHVVAGAYSVPVHSSEPARFAESARFLVATRLLPHRCHARGAGQTFRTQSLREAGGFDTLRWNFAFEDHEVIHRMRRKGRIGYSRELWCMPSPREQDRASVGWTLLERLLYAVAAPIAPDWFFYSFLARRLQRRRLLSNRMRERRYHQNEGPALVSSHPVR